MKKILAFWVFASALVFAGGCQTVATAAEDASNYKTVLGQAVADYGKAIDEFNQKIKALPSTKEADKLKQEALTSLQADLVDARTKVEAMAPPLKSALQHPIIVETMKSAEKVVQTAGKTATSVSADALKSLGKQLEGFGGVLESTANKMP